MQYGEGNFLRAFIDWQIDKLNETSDLNAGVAVIRPIDYDAIPLLNVQDFSAHFSFSHQLKHKIHWGTLTAQLYFHTEL